MRPSASRKRDGLDILHRGHPRGDDADGLIDRHHRSAEGKAIVGQLRHVLLSASVALLASTSSIGIADAQHHGGDGLDIIEMGGRQRGFNRDVGRDADNAGIVGKQQRLAVGGAMHLDLAMRLALEALDDDEIDPRHLRQQFRQPRLGGAAQFMHQRPALAGGHQHLGRAGLRDARQESLPGTSTSNRDGHA